MVLVTKHNAQKVFSEHNKILGHSLAVFRVQGQYDIDVQCRETPLHDETTVNLPNVKSLGDISDDLTSGSFGSFNHE